MIPKFSLLASQGRNLPLHGDGMAVRSYLYVEDVAEAFDVVLHRGVPGEIYNIGTKKERTVKEVAEEICGEFGLDPTESVEHVRDRAFNDQRYVMFGFRILSFFVLLPHNGACRYFISDDKLLALGWKERTPWKEGLKKTIDWYVLEIGMVSTAIARDDPTRSHVLPTRTRLSQVLEGWRRSLVLG